MDKHRIFFNWIGKVSAPGSRLTRKALLWDAVILQSISFHCALPENVSCAGTDPPRAVPSDFAMLRFSLSPLWQTRRRLSDSLWDLLWLSSRSSVPLKNYCSSNGPYQQGLNALYSASHVTIFWFSGWHLHKPCLEKGHNLLKQPIRCTIMP